MKVGGDEYKLKTGVIVEVIDDMLTIGVIQKNFVVDEQTIIFCLNVYKCTYDTHYHAYILGDETTCRIVSRSSIFYSGTVRIHPSHVHELYVIILLYFTICFMYTVTNVTKLK